MVSEKDKTRIRRFVCGQLRDEPDLSALTLGILKKRYLAHVGCHSLSPDVRNYMKQVVQEELMKMQDSDESGSNQETKNLQNKRKREKEDDMTSESDESNKKKARCQPSSSSESEDKIDCKSESDESEGEAPIQPGSKDTEQEVKTSEPKTNGNDERHVTSKDSTDEESSESEKEGNQSDSEDKLKEKVTKKVNTATDEETKSRKINEEKKTSQSDNHTDTDSKSETSSKIKDNDSSDDGTKVSTEKKNNEPDSDSSSLPSLEDEQNDADETKKDNKKKKTAKKAEGTKEQKGENKAIVRLKRYISLCGVRRNYKKLLDGCRSVRSKVAVLKKELEDLGVHGNPSIDKCKKVRMKREEAQELAELDVSNIIATQGRPKRRGVSAWQEPKQPPPSTYKRTLNSDSDNDEVNDAHRGHRRPTDWANLQGIISDDGESD